MTDKINIRANRDITFDMLYDGQSPGDGRDFRIAIPAGTRGEVVSVDAGGVAVDFAGSDYDWVVPLEWLTQQTDDPRLQDGSEPPEPHYDHEPTRTLRGAQ